MAETQRGLSAGMGQEEVALSGDSGRSEEGWGPVHRASGVWGQQPGCLVAAAPRCPAPGQVAGRAPGSTGGSRGARAPDVWSASVLPTHQCVLTFQLLWRMFVVFLLT